VQPFAEQPPSLDTVPEDHVRKTRRRCADGDPMV